MSAFALRAAAAGDASFMYDVSELTMRPHVEAAGRRWATEKMREKCEKDASDPNNGIVLVDGEPAGLYSAPVREGTLWIDMLFLLPAVQRRGIGSELVRRAVMQAAVSGMPLCIKVMKTNPARAFWLARGFEPIDDDGLFITMKSTAPFDSA